jgi:16S rRNA (guanine966-N2)-methyltransferase
VESARAAAQVCRTHPATLGLPGVRVAPQRVAQFLAQPAGPGDLAFLDPPYEATEVEVAEALTALVPHLAATAVVVVERSVRTPEPAWPSGLRSVADKRYGETVLWFAEPDTAPS